MGKLLQAVLPYGSGDTIAWPYEDDLAYMAPCTEAWTSLFTPTFPVPEDADLVTTPTRVMLDVWIVINGLSPGGGVTITYEIRLHDGTVLGTGDVPVGAGFTGKFPIIDETLAAGIIGLNSGIRVTMKVNGQGATASTYKAVHTLSVYTSA